MLSTNEHSEFNFKYIIQKTGIDISDKTSVIYLKTISEKYL